MVRLLVLCSLLGLPACLEGDRAMNGGECPAGETCSDHTPRGLRFEGARLINQLFPEAIPGTAIGGVQTIALSDVATDAPIAVPWRAELDGPLAVERQEGPRVLVKGVAEGSTTLRIVDPATGALHDRHALSASPVQAIATLSGAEPTLDRPVAWIAGADIDAILALEGPAGRLVDEQLTAALAEPGSASLERVAWD